MKKLKKVKTTLQDSIEAYEGVCNCVITCNVCHCPCMKADQSVQDSNTTSYSALESSCLSISNSHWSWA